jgi:hypothetical protein
LKTLYNRLKEYSTVPMPDGTDSGPITLNDADTSSLGSLR